MCCGADAMDVGREGLWSPWILKISAEKVVFLVSSEKNQISPFLLPPLEKRLEKSTNAPPLKKSFRRT